MPRTCTDLHLHTKFSNNNRESGLPFGRYHRCRASASETPIDLTNDESGESRIPHSSFTGASPKDIRRWGKKRGEFFELLYIQGVHSTHTWVEISPTREKPTTSLMATQHRAVRGRHDDGKKKAVSLTSSNERRNSLGSEHGRRSVDNGSAVDLLIVKKALLFLEVFIRRNYVAWIGISTVADNVRQSW